MKDSDFRRREDFEQWLESRPSGFALSLALRAAMRVAPLALIPDHRIPIEQFVRILSAFQLTFLLGWMALRRETGPKFDLPVDIGISQFSFPSLGPSFADAMKNNAIDAVAHVFFMLETIQEHSSIIRMAGASLISSFNAEKIISDEYGDGRHESEQDAFKLERGFQPGELRMFPLWRKEPAWFLDSWERAREAISEVQPEGTFATWFERRIRGEIDAFPFRKGGEAEFKERLILRDDKWWGRGPTAVDADIAEWLRELAPDDDLAEDELRRTLRETASPEIFVVDGQLDARSNSTFEQPKRPGPDQLEHLMASARLLETSFHANAPPRLKGALREYGDTIQRNRQRPVLQTLVLCATIIAETRQHEDFGFWGENLGTATDLFLDAHRKWVENHPGQNDLSEARAGLKMRDDASIQQAVADFIGSARGILEQLKTADLTRDRAYEHLKAQLDLGLDLIYGPADRADDTEFFDLPPGWTPLQTYAANQAGIWLQVETHLGSIASITAHPYAVALAGQVGMALGPFIAALF